MVKKQMSKNISTLVPDKSGEEILTDMIRQIGAVISEIAEEAGKNEQAVMIHTNNEQKSIPVESTEELKQLLNPSIDDLANMIISGKIPIPLPTILSTETGFGKFPATTLALTTIPSVANKSSPELALIVRKHYQMEPAGSKFIIPAKADPPTFLEKLQLLWKNLKLWIQNKRKNDKWKDTQVINNAPLFPDKDHDRLLPESKV